MYQWVSSEVWLLFSIAALYVYFFKAIDYKCRWNSTRNFFIVISIPIAILQFCISLLELFYQKKILNGILFNTLMIYGAFYLSCVFYKGVKNNKIKKKMIATLSFSVFCIVLLIIVCCISD